MPPSLAHRGFTFIELMVSLAVLAVLASVAVPTMQLESQRRREEELRVALRQIRTALDAYKQAYDDGRINHVLDASGYPPDLDTLVTGVVDASRPDRRTMYFLRRIPRDPFHPDGSWGLRSYVSSSEEPEAGADVYDVYSLSDAIGLNGEPYRSW